MTKLLISLVVVTLILLTMAIIPQDVYGPLDQPQLDDRNYNEIKESKVIPEWVKNQFEWYLTGEIDEGTLLTSMNWMFDNNIMHLSEKAAQEVKQLREENQKYKELLGHELTHTIQQGTSGSNSQSNPGERVMQPEFGSSQSKVTVRGWDPEKKEEIVGSNKAVAKFVVELYAESLSLSDVIWLPMTEGEVLIGYEGGDPERPIIIGRIYNESSQIDSSLGTMSSPGLNSVEKIRAVGEKVDNILLMGGSLSTWQENISRYQTDSSQDSYASLNEMVFLYSNAIDKKTIQIDSELEILSQWLKIISENQKTTSYDESGRLTSGTATENMVQYRETDFNFITGKLANIDQEIKALKTGLDVLEAKVSLIGEDSQLANIDLQNSLQKLQQTLQILSNVSKAAHDTAMASIRNMK